MVGLLLFSVIAVGFSGCSQESTAFIPVQWHNLNAHYNAYFLAREKMKEAEKEIQANAADNFNRILEVYPPITAQVEGQISPKMLEAIKKASINIQRHKNSEWVDDSYIVIGKGRYYKSEEYELAINTFRYVNSKSKDFDTRHQSMIWLFRTYLKGNDMNNARLIMDYLRKQPLSKQNMCDYQAVKAWFYYKDRDWKNVADALERSVKLMPPLQQKDTKARYHYIIGQIRQRLGDDSAAYANFKRCNRLIPVFEMQFNAQLSMAASSVVKDPAQVKRVEKNFRKMLKDLKYEDYKDKVYYELGRFTEKKGNLDSAIALYNLSLKQPAKSVNQKGYSYLKLAEIYYSKKREYVKAKIYYDSTVIALDTNEENYKKIVKLQKSLVEFVREYEVVYREDSLLSYAKMDSVARDERIARLIERDQKLDKKKKVAADKAEREARKAKIAAEVLAGGSSGTTFDPNKASGFNPASGGAEGSWYFANPANVARGQNDFIKKWGKRTLADDWRRSQKLSEITENPENKEGQANSEKTEPEKKEDDPKKPILSKADLEKVEAQDDYDKRRKRYLQDVPRTQVQFDTSHVRLRRALFNLAKIYQQRLDEYKNAEVHFYRVINEYPDYEKVPEAYYFLYLQYSKNNETAKREEVKTKLLTEYSNSTFAKLLLNHNYLIELRATNDLVKGEYQKAYELFEDQRYIESQQALVSLKSTYTDHEYKDKVGILEALIVGRTLDYKFYEDTLNRFIQTYPKSNLKPFAETLLKRGKDFMAKAKLPAGTIAGKDSTKKGTPYNAFITGDNTFVLLCGIDDISEEELKSAFSRFNGLFYPEKTFDVRTRLLSDKVQMLTVSSFGTPIQALNYLKKQQEDKAAIKNFRSKLKTLHQFVITPDNLRLFYASKNIEEYLLFFKNNYDLGGL